MPETPLFDIDHYVIGDGALCCVVEASRASGREPYGLLLGVPGMLARRESTLLWHPEHRLRRTMLTAIVDGVRHAPRQDATSVTWGPRGVLIEWRAGDVLVRESLHVARGTLVRDVAVEGVAGRRVRIEAALYANPTIVTHFDAGRALGASGLATLTLEHDGGTCFERFVTSAELRIKAADREYVVGRFVYATSLARSPEPGSVEGERHPMFDGVDDASPATRLLALARRGLRAAISREGRFNASLFQYEFEWGLDAAMVVSAASAAGDRQLAKQVLENILTRLSNDDGMIAEAGRFRGGDLSELNGNGAVLDAAWRYWLLTRDSELVRRHWERIVAIAEYPLREEFAHECGLLRTRRDFWERYPWQGVGDGFELGHQVFCSVGLDSAAELADMLGDARHAERWRAASRRIHDAMMSHPTHSLVENGRFIRRRLVDGRHESALTPDASWRSEEYAPYLPATYDTAPRACEPDVTEILPIVYRLVDPNGELAAATLEAIEQLWSPNGIGGCARYNVASEPDSPGPWPFATAFVAAAQIEGGSSGRAARTVEWLIDAAGVGGSWLEFYGERQSPPHPPVGIIVWGWAQYILLAIEHMAGVRIERDRVVIDPRMAGIAHSLPIGDHEIRLEVRGLDRATLDGEPHDGPIALTLPLDRDHDVLYS